MMKGVRSSGKKPEAAERWPHHGDPIPRVAGEHSVSQEGQREVEDLRRLHGLEQSLPKGLLPAAQH